MSTRARSSPPSQLCKTLGTAPRTTRRALRGTWAVAVLAVTASPSSCLSLDAPLLVEGTHTTHFGVADAAGNAVALTTTINAGYGRGVVVAGAGFLLNDEMDDFAVKPGAPNAYGLVQGRANAIAPGKRMLSSMSPIIVVDAQGAPFMVTGAQGGSRIITVVWQVMSNVIDYEHGRRGGSGGAPLPSSAPS